MLALFTISLSVLSAQQTLTGMVFDISTSEAVEGANVGSRPSGVGTSTGASGRFALEINQGDSVLVVEHIAFERSIETIKNPSVDMRIGLSEKIISLSELDVIGETGRGEFSQFETKNMVSDINVSDISIRSYSDIGDVLLNEESVLVSESSTGAKTLSIRGARQEEMI